MLRLHTASRLHFGLLSLPGDQEAWPDRLGQPVLPARRFGGVGLMVESPGLTIRAEPADAWSAQGPLAERAMAFASRFACTLEEEGPDRPLPPHRLVIESAPREHVGLGVGTQLGLAVAGLLAGLAGANLSLDELARRVGRGERSALGAHGFAHGGFLVDGGKGTATGLAPLLARVEFPDDWRVVLVLPGGGTGLHGSDERAAFARLGMPGHTTEALCRLVLLGLLPALAERDLPAFAEALFDFNARVGEAFSLAQGGTYANPLVSELVRFIRQQGVAGVGQSSWGPAVFAVTDPERGTWLAKRLRSLGPARQAEVWVTTGCNRGAEAESE